MSDPEYNLPQFRMLSVGLAVVAITAAFVGMIWNFLIALFLAAIFSEMSKPLYRRVLAFVKGRTGVASVLSLIILYSGLLVPMLIMVSVAAVQAGESTATFVAFVQQLETQEVTLSVPEWLPYDGQIQVASERFAAKISELIGSMAGYFVSTASAVTRGTASFFLSLFVMTYAMVYFIQDETSVFLRLMRFSGLPQHAQDRLATTVVSVSRATLKGTLSIGIIQGVLGGLGFAVAGIEGAAFWGMIMAVASVIPGIGPALVWVPGVVYLLAKGSLGTAVALALWSGLIVSTIDNVLRPRLVGRDTKLPDILVLVSTLGGLAMLGAPGLVIGPVIAALFIAIWDIFEDAVDVGRNEEMSAAS